MEHPAEGTLLEWLDGGLPPSRRTAVQDHVAGCGSCALELERLRGLAAVFDGAMGLLDPPAPAATAYAAVQRRRRSAWGAHGRRALARAALLVLGVAGIASATLPGSPVRRWIEERFGAGAADPARTLPPSADSARRAPAAEPLAGVEILPQDGRVRVVLNDIGPALRVRVRLADGEYVDVRGTGAAADAQFRTAPGRVSVTGAAGGEIHVALPRQVRHATVVAGGRTFLVKEGDQIRVLAPAADTTGPEIIFRVGG